MTHATPDRTKGGRSRSARRTLAGLVGLAALLLATLATASPAQAGSSFREGFEHEMGRIAAHHVAAFGAVMLHVAHDHHVAHRAPRFAHRAEHRVERRHRTAHRRAYRHARGHHAAPCKVAHRGKRHRHHH